MNVRRARARLPSIQGRLANALVVWSLTWGVAVAAAVWLAAGHEVDELLDDTLRSSAELLGALAATPSATPAPDALVPLVRGHGDRFAWQVIDAGGRVQLRSSLAPEIAWRATASPGFGDAHAWRLYGLPLGPDGRMLYAAQARSERLEARLEVVLSAALAALSIGLLGQFWLRARIRAETSTLQALSDQLSARDPLDLCAALGPAERRELEPVHQAIDKLTKNLAQHIDTERAFAGHAAHALRTPLAGIDAQLAVALRECPESMRPRLRRAREAAARLRNVVSALLGLFRSGAEPDRRRVDLAELAARLPVEGVDVKVDAGASVHADVDLLAAALLNLLDNAHRYGAHRVTISTPAPDTVRLHDDGPGVDAQRSRQLRDAIAAQSYEGRTGLGLMLADRVARAHDGELLLPESSDGFVVELRLGPG